MGNVCTADKAIDGDYSTYSLTQSSKFSWWSVVFGYTVEIEKILITASGYGIQSGYFDQFKVETKVTSEDPWRVCKGEHSIPTNPHIVKCDNPTIAKYLRLSTSGKCYLKEVHVVGTPIHIGKN